MGAPKQKWTAEEEAALKAGVAKYGAGKWSTILKDPEFGDVLCLRSNVDLKDKWRNINVAANGWGSRHRVKVAFTLRNNQHIAKHDDVARKIDGQTGAGITDPQPLAVSSGIPQIAFPKKPFSRLDNLIVEAIGKLKEPCGSTRAAIGMYIEEQYLAPPDLGKLLGAALKLLIKKGKLIKEKNHYKIPPDPKNLYVNGDPSPITPEGKLKTDRLVQTKEIKIPTKAEIDAELEKMKSMTAQEAVLAAAQAVAEAEAAIAEAEAAAKDAEQAEEEAEAAQAFAEAAMKAYKNRAIYS
ncbi:telomere repeat-binding factor 1-like [Diospyros lotus]|uniref:telomere repeat-binding factor 1-like n=1 Tax=Diospyros lotus TaxID=55363 RepID=UPI00224F5C8E|nr:telomere repeat-binding factor 1-like [Diospyros lotus]XP_052196239.1 telomere repeat-binding factor 1-like [Diospyros lotus]XP_052196240.1 telomere repeat-binding factor 1-like [Diospyros lotus]XP_052196242.1 telomere repeat-binding factor 1-like [Diospyros lotus]XP_052196243.1 telomere repeat-binding factor 1-like [Diospyros lotus]